MISIIIPTYNRAEMLRDALLALANYNPNEFECIVVDDASSDRTQDVILNLQDTWGKDLIKYVYLHTNQGAQVARNKGIELSKGDFILFMDSDDMPNPQGILNLKEFLLQNHSINYCYGKIIKTNSDLEYSEQDKGIGEAFDDKPIEIAGYHWHTMGALYRKTCIDKVGNWNVELTGSQDWEYQARVKIHGGEGKFINQLIGYWRQHNGLRVGTSSFRPDYVRSVMLACDSVLTHAKEAGKCDRYLEQRIAKRLIIHALEFGANQHQNDRNQCLRQAFSSLSHLTILKFLITILKIIPSSADSLIWKLLSKK